MVWDLLFLQQASRNMPSKGLVYYTDNLTDPTILTAGQSRLNAVGLPIVSVSLKPIDFGQNIVLPLERSCQTMFKQILTGIEAATTDFIFLVEHDVLYHPSHFEFTPSTDDKFFYNLNSWKVRSTDGQALFYICQQTGFCVASRRIMLEHYRERVARVEKEGFRRYNGYEPGTHRVPRGYCNYGSDNWMAATPNIDIRHANNLTWSRWRPDQFRRKVQGWQLADDVPGWGHTKGRFDEFLKEHSTVH